MPMKPSFSRALKALLLIFPLIFLAVLAFIGQRHSTSKSTTRRKGFSFESHPAVLQEIRGFRFKGFHDRREIISIKADKFSIERKKIGFFRFGLMNEAKLENAIVNIYVEVRQKESNFEAVRNTAKDFREVTFDDVFSKDALPSMLVKRISSVSIVPVRLVLLNGDSPLATISAQSATVRLRERDILFRGKVKLTSGNRVLTTNEMLLLPEKGTVQCDHNFQLTASGKERSGVHLNTDIFLD